MHEREFQRVLELCYQGLEVRELSLMIVFRALEETWSDEPRDDRVICICMHAREFHRLLDVYYQGWGVFLTRGRGVFINGRIQSVHSGETS